MRIYIDRLKEGQEHTFDEEVSCSDIFDKDEIGTVINQPLSLSFKAYLAGHELVIEWHSIKAVVRVCCTICNEFFDLPLAIEGTRHIEPLSAIRGAVFNPASLVREQILLDVPAYAECTEGCCPQREALKDILGRNNYGSTT